MKSYTQIKLFLLFLMFFCANSLLAQVNVTQPTGGQNISNDLSSVGTAPAYTPIGDIVIAETAPGDFNTGAAGYKTITLTRPTNWQFNAGTATVSISGNNISNVSLTANSATAITVRYYITAATDGSNQITISNIQAQSTVKTLVSGYIYVSAKTANTMVGITAGNVNTGTKVAPLSKVAGAAAQLLALLPNQTLSPGSATGKTPATGATPTAGTPFNVKVYATDYAWNPVASTDEINITSNDTYAVLPANNNLDGTANGTDFSVTLRTAVISPAPLSQTITATNVTNGAITASTTTATRVNRGAFTKLLILFPNETLVPGAATGKTGTPDAPVAGVNYPVTIYGVDDCWNVISSNNNVGISAAGVTNFTPPANGNMSGGARTVNLLFKVAGETPTVTAANNTTPSITQYVAGLPTVVLGTFAKLQILLPGETNDPSSPTGKNGTPTAQTAATSFTGDITVLAVDNAWNPVTGVTDVIHLTSTDANVTMPSDVAMVNGVATFTGASITLITAGSQTFTATNVTDGTKTANTSSNITINAGAFAKLLITLPGETYAPGTLNGKTGPANAVAVNATFTVTVRAVDANWNVVNTVTDVVQLTTTDAYGVFGTNNLALTAGVGSFTAARQRTAGNTNTITATDVADNAKNYTTAPITVTAGAYARLVLILPGETEAPGIAAGKAGTPTSQVAGQPFDIKIRAVDAYGNIVTTVNNTVAFTATGTVDTYAQLPVNTALVNGVLDINGVTTYRTVGTGRRLTATDQDTPGRTSQSPAFAVTVGAFSKLLVLLPGETYVAGHPDGKTGTPTAPVENTPYTVTVYSVDAAWNKVTAPTDNVEISVTGVTNFTPPAAADMVAGVRAFNLTFTVVGETPNLTAADNTDVLITPYNTNLPAVVGGTFTKLLVLLPGETIAPGAPNGKTGTPTTQTAGTPFTGDVTVLAVDATWHPISGITHTIHLTSTDANVTMPADVAMINGVATFTGASITLVTAGSRTFTATDVTDGSKTANTSSNVTINAGTYAKLLITLPGQTYAPGTATGNTGTISSVAVNATFTLTVRAVDAYWNLVNTVNNTVQLTSTDAYAVFSTNNVALVAGIRNFTNTTRLRTAGNTTTITAENTTTNNPAESYTTAPITVTVGTYAKLVLILPGETEAPGIAAGKAGTPTSQVAGQPFDIKIRAVDAYGNIVTTVNNTIAFTATGTVDNYAQLPANTALVNGALDINGVTTYRTVGTGRRLTATDQATSYNQQSPAFTVNIGVFSRLLIILPGETYMAGHPNGKTGTPYIQGIGQAFNITVRATDNAYNTVTTPYVTNTVQITSTDGTFTPISAALASSVKTFSITLQTDGSTLTATDITNGGTPFYTTDPIILGVPSNASDYFQSKQSGNWSVVSSWESSADNATWHAATLIPDRYAKDITIKGTHTITITGANATAGTAGAMLIENGAQITLTSGRTLTIYNGAATNDLVVEGVLRNQNGTITRNSNATLQFAATGKYQHSFTTSSGTIPTAGWVAGSTCEVLSYTTYAGDVTGSNQTFSNFVWNAPAQTGAGSPSLLNGFTATNLTVTSTGSGTLNLASVGGTTTITGNYTQAAGTVVANKTSGTQTLNIGGDFLVNGGNFALGNGTVNVTFNGSSAQSLSNAGSELAFTKVTFSNGGTKTLSSGAFAVATTGFLTMGAGTTLNANGNLVLKSDATSSATIPAIPNDAEITGNVTVQRYITGGTINPYRTYRMLSSPIYDNGNASSRTYNYTQFIDDMIITGTGGATNGFDNVASTAASAWTYNNGSFVPLSNISTSQPVGMGAYIFYRGDKSNMTAKVTPPFVNPENTVMDFVGVLNQQDVETATLTSGFNLVGNPYASSINWDAIGGIDKAALSNNKIQIWNPGGAYPRQYATYDGVTSVNGGSAIIPSGQGFFVEATGGGKLKFTETAKVQETDPVTQPSILLMSTPIVEGNSFSKGANGKLAVASTPSATVAAENKTELRLALSKDNTPYRVETVVVFKDGKSANFMQGEDALYSKGEVVFLSSMSQDKTKLAINYMPQLANGANVKFDISDRNSNSTNADLKVSSGNYKLKVNLSNLPSDYSAKLNDNYLNTSVAVQNGDEYPFTINTAQAASYGDNRFSVSFEVPTTLPVELTSFKAVKTNQGVVLNWHTATERNQHRFELQRASESQDYQPLYTVAAKGSGSAYSFTDKAPLLGNNYYRLIQVDNDNKTTTGEPLVVNYTGKVANGTDAVAIFPNPVITNFTVVYNGTLGTAHQTIKVLNTVGQVLWSKQVSKTDLLTGLEVNATNYPAGVYVVELYEEGGQRIGQTKLIKK